MPEDFKAALRRMIEEEPARRAQLQSAAEQQRQATAAEQQAIDEVQPVIAERIQQVSTLLSHMAGDVNTETAELGFSADVGTFRQSGQTILTLNIHGQPAAPLRITVNRIGDVFFDPGYASPFNILRSDDGPIVDAVTAFVQNTYRTLVERRPG